VPSLPTVLGGDIARAQLVIAAYVGGTAVGLIAFACTRARDINTLIVLRALQGAVAAGPVVYAPGIVRAMFDDARAVRAFGLLGSIEALAGSLPQTARRERGSYASLLVDAVFLRYALSQAFVLGGLLTFVFGMPAVFVPVNAGLGLRGPPGFFRAVVAARNDDARGAALVILGILGAAAIGTTLAAPFVGSGLVHLAAIAAGFQLLAVITLGLLPRLQ
jgi:MFS family permease